MVFKRLSDLIEFAEEVTDDALLHAEEFLDSLHQTDSYQTDNTQEARDKLSHPKEALTPEQPTLQDDHATAQHKTLEHPHQHRVSGDDPIHDTYRIENETVDHEDIPRLGTPMAMTPQEQHAELHGTQSIMGLQTEMASDSGQEANNSTLVRYRPRPQGVGRPGNIHGYLRQTNTTGGEGTN